MRKPNAKSEKKVCAAQTTLRLVANLINHNRTRINMPCLELFIIIHPPSEQRAPNVTRLTRYHSCGQLASNNTPRANMHSQSQSHWHLHSYSHPPNDTHLHTQYLMMANNLFTSLFQSRISVALCQARPSCVCVFCSYTVKM